MSNALNRVKLHFQKPQKMVENTPQMPLSNTSYEVRVAKEQKFRADLVRDKTEMEYRFRSH